jgi:hypothetical protein
MVVDPIGNGTAAQARAAKASECRQRSADDGDQAIGGGNGGTGCAPDNIGAVASMTCSGAGDEGTCSATGRSAGARHGQQSPEQAPSSFTGALLSSACPWHGDAGSD